MSRGEQLGVPKAEGLYSLQAMVHPIALRFRFHFEGSRQTNQLDKVYFPATRLYRIADEQLLSPNGTLPTF
jgi:hypothetical protein